MADAAINAAGGRPSPRPRPIPTGLDRLYAEIRKLRDTAERVKVEHVNTQAAIQGDLEAAMATLTVAMAGKLAACQVVATLDDEQAKRVLRAIHAAARLRRRRAPKGGAG